MKEALEERKMKNNMNIESIEETRGKLLKGEFPKKKAFEVSGEWLFEEGRGQFRSKLSYPKGSLELIADQAPPMGGSGVAPNPVQYCVFAMIACFATTFVTIATERGIEIKGLKARGATEANMPQILGLEEGPIVDRVWVELDVDSDAPRELLDEIREIANRKCPAAFTVQNRVTFESKLV